MNYEPNNDVSDTEKMNELQMQVLEDVGTYIFRAAGQSYADAIHENYEQALDQYNDFKYEKIFLAEKELKELEKRLSPLEFENSRRSDREEKLRNGIAYSGIFDFRKKAQNKKELKELLSTPPHDTSALEEAIEKKEAQLQELRKQSKELESRVNKLRNECSRLSQVQREKQLQNRAFRPKR